MIRLFALLLMATPLAADPVKVRRIDFPLPLGLEEKLPAGVPETEVFVTDDACYYYRKDDAFHFLGCVG